MTTAGTGNYGYQGNTIIFACACDVARACAFDTLQGVDYLDISE